MIVDRRRRGADHGAEGLDGSGVVDTRYRAVPHDLFGQEGLGVTTAQRCRRHGAQGAANGLLGAVDDEGAGYGLLFIGLLVYWFMVYGLLVYV